MGNSGSLFFSENAVLRSVPRRRSPVRGSDCRKRTTIMKRAIHFGAGKIGRGFIGALLSQAGYEVCFAEADPQLVDEINRRRGYTVHVMDEICAELRIAGVSAVRADSGEAVRRLVDADLVTTAVGLGVLPRVAPVIAAGLRARKAAGVAAPLNVVACENGVRADLAASGRRSTRRLAAAEAAAWCGRARSGSPTVRSTASCRPCAVREPARRGRGGVSTSGTSSEKRVGGRCTAYLSGMHLADELVALHRAQALYAEYGTLRITAYLGRMKGHRRRSTRALADPADLRASCKEAMQQSGQALVRKVRFRPRRSISSISTTMHAAGSSNPYLKDDGGACGARCRCASSRRTDSAGPSRS